jgi:DNA-binding transcriptional ArsR family regulator
LAESADNDAGIDQRLVRLASEPTRLRALFVLSERAGTVAEIAEELAVGEAEVARHLSALHDAGLIELVGEVLHRGGVEPRYRATERLMWSGEEWAALGLAERRRLSAWIVQTITDDVGDALEAGTFDARIEGHVSRTVSLVDEQGWRELNQIHDDALDAIFVVQAASAERLAENRESGIPALSAMICCELPARATEPS